MSRGSDDLKRSRDNRDVDWSSEMQGTQLRCAIKFVAGMDKAVKFYRDVPSNVEV